MLSEVLSADIDLTPSARYYLLVDGTIFANQQNDFQAALRYTQEALSIARAMNSQMLIADGLIGHAMVCIQMGDYAQTKQAALEALRIGRRIQDPEQIVGALNLLGKAVLEEGDVRQAAACYEEAYALCQAPDWRQDVYAIQTCEGMGAVALSRRDYEPALRFLREGLEHSTYPVLDVWILDSLAGVIGTMPRRTTADVCRAARIWGAVEVFRETTGMVSTAYERRRTEMLIADARARIDARTFAAAWAAGRGLSLDKAIALAME
jgi:tetratricopeptide (TPR) repeat protein